jgi:SAM-dependent methyltransferase
MGLREKAIDAARSMASPELRSWVVRQQRRYGLQWPRVGNVQFGQLRRVTPISPVFGLDRGLPVDRYYIEKFLKTYSADIQGRVMELGDPFYINKFGGDRVTHPDILHVVAGNPQATIVADLTDAPHIPDDTFDCIIFTQSLQMILDMKAALRTLHRILKPGGVLLLTSAGISKIGRRLGKDDWGEYWHLTTQGLEVLAKETFPNAETTISSMGNVLSATCYLHGMATEELTTEELDYRDPDIEMLVTGHIRKQA